jgi:gamma-glutamylcyclotransferase (GGCT)/AIG2-like uncharacterized protein YtfP
MHETLTTVYLPRNSAESATSQGRHVFVYGTLRKGEDNDINRLRPAPGLVGQATVLGTLYHLGRYPGLLLTGSTAVVGEIYGITPELERVLDEIEEVYPQRSDEYSKQLVPVDVNGRTLLCLVYEVNPLRLQDRSVIVCGDWVNGK